MFNPAVSTGHATNQLADTVSRKNPVRRLTAQLLPDDLCWLSSDGLNHPEASRAPELAFPFMVGRIEQGGTSHTVREAELVVAAGLAAGHDSARIIVDLMAYARFVVSSVPTAHARLSGRTLSAWQATFARSSRRRD